MKGSASTWATARSEKRRPWRARCAGSFAQNAARLALASAPRYGTITAKVGLRRRGGAWSGVVVDGGAAHSAFGGGRWQPPIMWCSYHEQPGETKWKPPSAAAASVWDAIAREM